MHPDQFDSAQSRLECNLKELKKTVDRKDIPKGTPGVYLFSYKGRDLYVGRTDDIRKRIGNHTGGGVYSAALARIIAKKRHFKSTHKGHGKKCMDELWKTEAFLALKSGPLKDDPEFKDRFNKAKKCVRKMDIGYVKIEDDIEQSIFEVYAHVKLNTPYNSFANH